MHAINTLSIILIWAVQQICLIFQGWILHSSCCHAMLHIIMYYKLSLIKFSTQPRYVMHLRHPTPSHLSNFERSYFISRIVAIKISPTIVGERVRIRILWYRINQRVVNKSLSVRLICCIPQIVFGIKRWQDKCICLGFLKFNQSEYCSHSLWFHPRNCVSSSSICRGLKSLEEAPLRIG